jgi:hypothetical protein
LLERERRQVESIQRGVGRVELLGHPKLDWAGTGFLVADCCFLTSRQVAEVFAEPDNAGDWRFRPGISVWINYQPVGTRETPAGCRVLSVVGVHEQHDLALLSVEMPHEDPTESPIPLPLAAEAPAGRTPRPVYLVGYPARDARRNEPERIAQIFRNAYNVKRVQPGTLYGELEFGETSFLQHDCAMLGQSGGSCLVDWETGQVLGLHVSGRYVERGRANPLWRLRDDELLKQASVELTSMPSPQNVEDVANRLRRLSRTKFWDDCSSIVDESYERAFGSPTGPKD